MFKNPSDMSSGETREMRSDILYPPPPWGSTQDDDVRTTLWRLYTDSPFPAGALNASQHVGQFHGHAVASAVDGMAEFEAVFGVVLYRDAPCHGHCNKLDVTISDKRLNV